MAVLASPDKANLEAATARTRLSSKWVREVFALLAVVCVCVLPFLDKPVHIDDSIFIWISQQIRLRWWDFYGGSINWYGTPMRAYQFMMNPPLTSFYLAGTTAMLGSAERAMHGGMLLPTLAATVGIYQLARRFCRDAALATAIAVLSPAFLVSATTLMSDVPMVCLWVWATVCWVTGVRENRQGLLLAAGLLLLAAALAKYFAACLLPLFILDALIVWRGFRWGLLWLVIPAGGLLAYQAYTSHLYGSGLLGVAVTYSLTERAREMGSARPRVLTGLSFAGGCILTAVPAGIVATVGTFRRTRAPLRWFGLAIGIAGYVLLLKFDLPAIARFTSRQRLPWPELLQLVLLSLSGIPILLLAVAALQTPADDGSLLLALWVIGTFVFVVGFNWTVNARTILPMAPAVAILAVRKLPPRHRWAWVALVPLVGISLLAAYADQAMAQSVRDASDYIQARTRQYPQTVWFQGHWGFEYYMRLWGAQPLDAAHTECLPGQIMVVPAFGASEFPVPPAAVSRIERFAPPQSTWISTIAPDVGAGFYSDVCGPLPFAFGSHQPDSYDVLGVVKSIQYSLANAPQQQVTAPSASRPGGSQERR